MTAIVFGKNDPSEGAEWIIVQERNASEAVVCENGHDGECSTVGIIDDLDLDYTYYSVRLRFLNGGMFSDDTVPFLGDVRFTFWTGHSGYSTLELALRIVFLFVAAGILIVFLFALRKIAFAEWAWEQRALVLLLLALIGFNNPFFGLQYVARGWFFHFLDAFLNLTFLSLFLLFGLLVLDKIRLEDVRMELGKKDIPKFIVVGIFAVLGITLFSWVDIRDDLDPILEHPEVISGVEVLFYIEATIYAGILIWLAILVVMTFPVATAKPYLMTRFLFASIPTSLCIISILIGIFNGTFGPLNESTLSMVYFLTLFNEFVWVLTFGFWPVQEKFAVRNPSEADPIIQFDNNI